MQRTRACGWPAVIAALLALATLSVPAPAAATGGTGGNDLNGLVVGTGDPEVVPGSYIVVYREPADRTGAARSESLSALTGRLSATYDATVTHTYTAALAGFAARMSGSAASRLAADPAVAYVVVDHRLSLSGTQVNPPSWGLDRIDQRDRPLDQRYTYSGTASNVHMYIIDSGIRVTHQDFGGRASFDFNSIDTIDTDCNGHGTHVAGIAGGATYGVAKGVRLHAVKVADCAGDGSASTIIAGVDWVTANRVRPAVANMSVGILFNPALNTAVANSMNAGVAYVVSAGNANDVACQFSPAIAGASTAIGVGATTITDARASFSNFGQCVDLYAPGQGIVSASIAHDAATAIADGTSQAAPHAAGAAALYLASHPSATVTQVHDAVVYNSSIDRLTGMRSCCGPAGQSTNRLLHSTFQPPGPGTAVLNPGGTLHTGESIRSNLGNHLLVMQTDGNLVHYQGSKPLWHSATGGNPGAFAVLQQDGNFVIYSSGGAPLWSTGTAGTTADRLIMQDDANLVLYGPRGAGRPGLRAFWSTR